MLVGIEGSPSMGVTITSSDPLRGGRPDVARRRTAELISGEGIFVEEMQRELAERGLARVRGDDDSPAARSRSARAIGPRSTALWRR